MTGRGIFLRFTRQHRSGPLYKRPLDTDDLSSCLPPPELLARTHTYIPYSHIRRASPSPRWQ